MRKKQIQYLESDSTYKVPSSVQEEWNAMAPPTAGGGGGGETVVSATVYEQAGPLLQTTWDQGVPYNDSVPYLNCLFNSNGRAFTGCDATATAQVMRYWEYPSTYNWSIMPDIEYSKDPITPGIREVAKLMRDVGAAVGMNYGCDGSYSNITNDRNALVNTFGYSSNASVISYDSTNTTKETYLVTNLQGHLPVIMRGTDLTHGGHAWVCDGYKRTLCTLIHNPGTYYEYTTVTTIRNFYLSMNWGWNGDWNGWYLFSDFDPDVYSFNHNTAFIIDIHP